jgi:Tol biopolymer transport system component
VILAGCDAGKFEHSPYRLPGAFSGPAWFVADSLLFYRDEGREQRRNEGIWVTAIDGSANWQCLRGAAYSPDYCPSRNALAFEAGGQIFTVDLVDGIADTLTLRQLTYECVNFFPAWSPDGEWIAFDRIFCTAAEDDGLYVIRADGDDLRFVDRGRTPSWSSDGQTLLYVRRGEVYSIAAWGSQPPVKLSSIQEMFGAPVSVLHPGYSPDGTNVIVEIRTHPGVALWLLPLDGGTARQIVAGKEPAWSPSIALMAFVRSGDPDPEANDTIWIYDFEGKRARQLTRR